MEQSLWNIVEEFREAGIPIEDEEAEYVYQYCLRKMEKMKVCDLEEYLPLLYRDEIRNYCFRKAVNAVIALRMIQKEESASV